MWWPSKQIDAKTGWTNTFQMLADEFAQMYRERPSASPDAPDLPSLQGNSGRETSESSPAALVRLYADFHAAPAFPRTALCLSGGGIRSAAFALGVIQFLAKADLLHRFEYLSTVSGGGYIGSFLSAWLTRAEGDPRRTAYDIVGAQLARREPPEQEAEEIQRLRENSNYLTPKLGLLSADTWTAIAIWLRNLLVNWFLLVPLICAAAIVPQIVSAIGGAAKSGSWAQWVQYAGIAFYALSLAALNASRPRWQAFSFRRLTFLTLCLAPLVLSAGMWAISLANPSTIPQAWEAHVASAVTSYFPKRISEYMILAMIIYAVVLLFSWLVNKVWAPPYVYTKAGTAEETSIEYTFARSRRACRGASVEVFADDHQAVAGKHYEEVKPTKIKFGACEGDANTKLDVKLLNLIGKERVGPNDIFIKFSNPIGLRIGGVFGWARTRDSIAFCISGACFGFFLAIGDLLFRPWLDQVPNEPFASDVLVKVAYIPLHNWTDSLSSPELTFAWQHLAWSTLAVPWLLVSHVLTTVIFVAVTSWSQRSDEEREWFGRAAGWFLAIALFWVAAAGLVLLLPLAAKEFLPNTLSNGLDAKKIAAAIVSVFGGASGVLTALVGGGPKTPAVPGAEQSGWRKVALYIGAPVFICSLFIGLSLAVDWIAFGRVFATEIAKTPPDGFWHVVGQLLLVGIGPAVAAVLIGLLINVNRFSLHELYRNRLVRAFLGASNTRSTEGDTFTGLNFTDNLPMSRLWKRKPELPRTHASVKKDASNADWRPFHVINIALNLVDAEKLAWQQRKAESFTVTPLWCGSAALDAFRRSSEYAGNKGPITLGTAMAISGAAVSPNMGYNSSPLITFLLTLFNVRLGWWLGNPRRQWFASEGPRVSALTLIMELFGLTNDRRKYVYLSDGGHFENLGLYEMVRRRCHLIILSDAGQDKDLTFADLSNAVRKISIDLGVRIDFPDLKQLRIRNAEREHPKKGGPCYTVGRIRYSEADKTTDDKDGYILYLKPGFRGDESADIIGYAADSKDFPHETTVDQWFSESQFESYRGLGFTIMERAYKQAVKNYNNKVGNNPIEDFSNVTTLSFFESLSHVETMDDPVLTGGTTKP